MARITVEDCLSKESNRFALVLLAAKRTKQLLGGSQVLIEDKRDNKLVVTSLREIAAGMVRYKTEEDLAKEREAVLEEREAQAASFEEATSPGDELFIKDDSSQGENDGEGEAKESADVSVDSSNDNGSNPF